MGLPIGDRDSTQTPPTPLGTLFWIVRALLVFAVLLVAAYKVADQYCWRKVQEQRLSFKDRFGAVDFRDFVPPRPPAEDDAGRVYQYAYALAARAGMGHDAPPLIYTFLQDPDAMEATLRPKMLSLAPLWPVLRKAAEKEGGVLTHFQRPGTPSTEADELRCLVDLMAAKAILDARSGEPESAAYWLESGMHLITLLRREPTIAAQTLRIRCIGAQVMAFEAVLHASPKFPALSEHYLEDWEAAADSAWFVRGMASELGLYWSVDVPGLTRLQRSRLILGLGTWFARIDGAMNAGPAPSTGVAPTFYFPGIFAQPASATAAELNKLAEALAPIATQERAQGTFRGPEPAALSHVLAACAFYQIPVRHTQVRLALALRAYREEHGVFPAALDDLIPRYLDETLVDPTTGTPMHYERLDGAAHLTSPGLIEQSPWILTVK